MSKTPTQAEQAAVYLCRHLPPREPVTFDLLVLMLYLADWKSVLEQDRPLTGLNWFASSTGPIAPALQGIIEQSAVISISPNRIEGISKVVHTHLLPSLAESLAWKDLGRGDIDVLRHVLGTVRRIKADNINRLVFSTYPMLSTTEQSSLNLSKLAKDYDDEAVAVGWRVR